MARYRVLDLPVLGVGAFTPTASTNPIASSWGLVSTYGSPGGFPAKVGQPFGAHQHNSPETDSSNHAPNMILPAIYIAGTRNMGPVADGFGMATRRLTPMPIPAMSWIAAAKQAMRGPKIGGRRAVDNPRAFQRFGSRNGAKNSGL